MADGKLSNSKLGLLIMAFIILILGITLLRETADSINLVTSPTTHVNATVTIASATGNLGNDNVTALTYFGNATISTDTAGITINEQVNFTANGDLTVNSGNFTDGSAWLATYTYEQTEFVSDGTSRTLLNLIIILFSLAVVAGAIAFGLRAFGIIDF